MGRAARANQIAQQARAGEIKPIAKETDGQKRDRFRATIPGYTRLALLKYMGIDSGVPTAVVTPNIKPKRKSKLTITKVED